MNQIERENLRNQLAALVDRRNRSAERLLAQMQFAEGLSRLRGVKRWPKLIAQAWQIVRDVVAAGRLDRLEKAVDQAERILAPVGKAAKKYTVHCVGHAHIDMNWMWSWPETVAVTLDTFRTVLKLMEEFPDFCFTQSQASVYAIVKEHDPPMLDAIARRVAEGRWEIAAAHWVEGDKNLASGESLARHLLYTRQFMAEQFGLSPEDLPLDWEPDTFGHAATIPTIVSRGAVGRYYFCRGGKFDKPPVFRWRGPDGSEILVNRETTWYNDHLGTHNADALLRFCEATGLTDWMCVYGIGDHGGGPTRRDIHRCHEMDAWPIYPRFRSATTRRYYEILEARRDELPVLEGELNFEFTGCYTSQSRIKRTHRLAENLLGSAEAAAALSWRAAGREYPGAKLREAWIDALLAHFHDILPGSGVRETREYHMGRFQQTAATATAVATGSLRALADAVDTSALAPEGESADSGLAMGAGVGLGTWWGETSRAAHAAGGPRVALAFNPSAWPRTETVRVTVWDSGDDDFDDAEFVVRLPDGSTVAAQRLGEAKDYWGHRHVDLAVPLTVPALGYTAFVVDPAGRRVPPPSHEYPAGLVGPIAEMEQPPAVRVTGPLSAENESVAVRIDSLTGGLVELIDKASGVNLVDPGEPAGLLEYVLERPGGMSAWTIHETQRSICPLEVHSVRPLADGPHVASIAAEMKLDDSTITVRWTLRAGRPIVEMVIEADWLERGSREIGTPSLRFRLPLALAGVKGLYEIPFGSLARDLNEGQEVPSLRWADATGRTPAGKVAGCTLLNDSKYGHSLDGSTLRLSLIRSSYEPDPLPEMGHHSIRLGLAPHSGRPKPADLIRLATAFNEPIRVLASDAHAGKLPASAAAVGLVRPAGVVLTGVKGAEDGSGLIFRLLETAGRFAAARVPLSADLLGQPVEAVEVDLLERPQAESTAATKDDGFTVRVPAFGIASVKVAFAERN